MTSDEPTMRWSWANDRVVLRETHESDLPTLVAWINSPEVAVNQVAGPFHPRPLDEAAGVFRNFSPERGPDLGLSILRRSDEKLAGHVMLWGVETKDRCANIAIVVGPEFQRQGLGRAALVLVLNYGFSELGLHRVELTVNSFNQPARALYRSLGFVEEGRRRMAIFRNGDWHDHLLMGLLDHEWITELRALVPQFRWPPQKPGRDQRPPTRT